MRRSGTRRQLGSWEVLGAWLHLWTPPRDVVVPPVPRAKLAALALLVVTGAIVFAAAGLPAIRASNDEAAQSEAVRDRARRAARVRRITAQQAPHRDRGTPARDIGGRRALVERLEAVVGADARARVSAGEFRGAIRRVDCAPTPRSRAGGGPPEEDPGRARAAYDCTAVTSVIPGRKGAALGYPFQGVVEFGSGRLTWCRTNPPPGEQVIPDPSKVVELPAACRDPGA